MSVLVNRTPQIGHFRLRLAVVSSIHFLQKIWGQVFKTTSLSLSAPHRHIILDLYSSSSILRTSNSELELILSCSLLYSMFFFSLSSISFSMFFSFSLSVSLSCWMILSFSFSSSWRELFFYFSVVCCSCIFFYSSIDSSLIVLTSSSIFSQDLAFS